MSLDVPNDTFDVKVSQEARVLIRSRTSTVVGHISRSNDGVEFDSFSMVNVWSEKTKNNFFFLKFWGVKREMGEI